LSIVRENVFAKVIARAYDSGLIGANVFKILQDFMIVSHFQCMPYHLSSVMSRKFRNALVWTIHCYQRKSVLGHTEKVLDTLYNCYITLSVENSPRQGEYMAKKKIKTFSVDEDIYNLLVTMLKDSGAEVSLSSFVDKSLKDLLSMLQAFEKVKAEKEGYTVPMSYVINEVVRSPFIRVMEVEEVPGSPSYLAGEMELEELQIEYEAENKKIPIRFWRYLRTGRFEMGPDKETIINKSTGIRYALDEDGLPVEYKEDEKRGTRKK
jgi:hypothetical protein